MYIIKLNAIDSTNAYLKRATKTGLPKDYTVVVAHMQFEGRGQMGTTWQAEAGKNLTVSVFKALPKLRLNQQFYISMVVSIALCKALSSFNIPRLRVKWPNDILSADKKICGILIENVVKNNQLEGSIIGFGLNVNQKYFDALPQASSLHLIKGLLFNKDEVLSEILKQLEHYFIQLENGDFSQIRDVYETLLFRNNKPSTFTLSDGNQIFGIIKGVTKTGKLKVWIDEKTVKNFDFKELKLNF